MSDIDESLSNDGETIPVVWDPVNGRWKYESETWADHLGIDKEYLTEKCRDRGADESTLQTIYTWGSDAYDKTPSRPPYGDETYLSTYRATERDLPDSVRSSLEEYTKITKESERRQYMGCKPSNVSIRSNCKNLACRKGIKTDQEYNRSIESSVDIDEIGKLSYCKEKKVYCPPRDSYFSPNGVSDKEYVLIDNRGGGDCLFYAVSDYFIHAEELGFYPTYEENQNPGDNPVKVPLLPPDEDLAHNLRQMAVRWMRENIDSDEVLATGLPLYKEMVSEYVSNYVMGMDKAMHFKSLQNVFSKSRSLTFFRDQRNFKKDERELNNMLENGKLDRKYINAICNLYCNNMVRKGVYAGFLEMIALANALKVNVLGLQISGNKYVSYMDTAIERFSEYLTVMHMGYDHWECAFPKSFLDVSKNKIARDERLSIVPQKPKKKHATKKSVPKLKSTPEIDFIVNIVQPAGNVSYEQLVRLYEEKLVSHDDNALKLLMDPNTDAGLSLLESDDFTLPTLNYFERVIYSVSEKTAAAYFMIVLRHAAYFYDEQKHVVENTMLEAMVDIIKERYIIINNLNNTIDYQDFFQELIIMDGRNTDPQIIRSYAYNIIAEYLVFIQWYHTINLKKSGFPIIPGIKEDLNPERVAKIARLFQSINSQ